MCSIGAAAWLTIFIVKSVEVTSYKENTLGALPIWPMEVESASTCIACFEDRGEHDPIMCEKVCPLHSSMRQADVQCEEAYHLDCLDPPLEVVPEDDWYCPDCELEGLGGLEQPFRPSSEWMKARKRGWRSSRHVETIPSPSVHDSERNSEAPLRREGSTLSRSESFSLLPHVYSSWCRFIKTV
jgi:hypothetical protein